MTRKFISFFFALALAAAFAAPSFAGPPGGGKGCNAGNGNGSEVIGTVECDPGNSGGNNNGGD